MNKGSRWIYILSITGILFLVSVVSVYYIPHKPFDKAFFFSVLFALKDLVLTSALIALAGGVGRRILANIHPIGSANLALQAAFGIGVLVLVYLVIGLAGLYTSWFVWILLLASLLVFHKSVYSWVCGWSEFIEELRSLSTFPKILALLITSIVVFRLVEALAPPVHYDALVYHLWLPSEFLDAGKFIFTPENPYWGMPLSSEMLYTWAMALGRPQTAAVLSWWIGILTIVGVVGLGKNISTRAGWVAAAALIAGETTSSSLAWAYADWGAAFQGLALLISLDAWRQQRSRSGIILAGLLAGFAFGFKYTAGVLIPAGWALIVIIGSRKDIRNSLLPYSLAAAGIVAIWLGKNYLFTKSLLYPFLGSSEWVDALKSQFFSGTASAWPPLRIILIPLSATLEGVEGAPGFSASIGPLLVGLTLGAFLPKNGKDAFVKGIGLFVLVGWLTWAGATFYNAFLGQSRLYFAIFPAWALLASAGFEGFASIRLSQIRFERLAGVFVVISLLFSGITTFREIVTSRPLSVVLGVEEDGVYLTRSMGTYFLAMEAVQNLSPDSSVLNLWEPRGFYCRPVCLADTWIDRWYLDRQKFGDDQSILESWRTEGFTHLLLHRAGMLFIQNNDARYIEDDWIVLEDLLGRLILVESFGDGFELYRLVQ